MRDRKWTFDFKIDAANRNEIRNMQSWWNRHVSSVASGCKVYVTLPWLCFKANVTLHAHYSRHKVMLSLSLFNVRKTSRCSLDYYWILKPRCLGYYSTCNVTLLRPLFKILSHAVLVIIQGIPGCPGYYSRYTSLSLFLFKVYQDVLAIIQGISGCLGYYSRYIRILF